MRILISNCRLVSPGIDWPQAYIAVQDQYISYVGTEPPVGDFAQVIDGTGMIATPGFIDIHSHGRSNFDFCDATHTAFAAIGCGKLSDGVTSFLATTLTIASSDLRKVCQEARYYAEKCTAGATLLGIHLEGPFINPNCLGAQNPDFVQQPHIALVDELNAIYPVKKVSYSPELPDGLELTTALRERGIMPSGGHSDADYECFVQNRDAGMRHLTHFCNVMTPLHHLHFGMVGGGLLSQDVYVEMICDGVHLCDQMIELIAKLKGPERMMLITDSIRAAAMPDGDYSLGGLPVLVKNGKATLHSGTVAGSTLLFQHGLKHLLRNTDLPLCEVIRTTSWNQAESLKLGKRGKLEPSFVADIVLLDQNLDPRKTICGGTLKWVG